MPLCGNSIGTDRRFLAAYLPEIEEYLHYRRSTCRRSRSWCGAGTPSVRGGRPRQAGRHRALDDIRESVAELRYYRTSVFRPRPRSATTEGSTGTPEVTGTD